MGATSEEGRGTNGMSRTPARAYQSGLVVALTPMTGRLNASGIRRDCLQRERRSAPSGWGQQLCRTGAAAGGLSRPAIDPSASPPYQPVCIPLIWMICCPRPSLRPCGRRCRPCPQAEGRRPPRCGAHRRGNPHVIARADSQDDALESLNVTGLVPAGEGAGYAGGILSAGIDGIRAAEALALQILATGPQPN